MTPFDADFRVDVRSMRSLVDFVLAKGAEGIVTLGTTGEFFTLTPRERVEVMTIVCDAVRGRAPVTVGVGADSTSTSVELAARAQQLGADCVMTPAPFYFARSGSAQLAHFRAIAAAVDIAVMLYDGADGHEVSVDTMARAVRSAPNVRYIKLGLPKPEKAAQTAAAVPELTVFAGDDVTLTEALRAGAVGSAIATGNIQADDLARLHKAHAAGDSDGATGVFVERLAATVSAIANPKQEFIARTKEVLAAMGIITHPAVRTPLEPIGHVAREGLFAVMRAARVL